jgi:hypothetical protein
MLRFIDGFDHYVSADLYLKWTTAIGVGLGAIGSGSLSTYLPIGATGRNSTNGLKLNGLGYGVPIQLRKSIDNQATWIIGTAVLLSATPSSTINLFRFLDGTTTQNEINVTSAGMLTWTRNGTLLASGTHVLSAGVFYYIECKFTIASSITAGTCVMRVNGVSDITLAATTNTQNTANAYASVIEFNCPSNITITFDDVYMCDGTGSTNKDFLGDVRVEAIYPNAAGNYSQWTPTGSATNHGCVSETPEDGDTTYNLSATAGNEDTFLFGTLASTPLSIFGIQTTIVNRKDDAGSRSIKSIVRIGGTDYAGATVGVASTYSFDTEIHETNPATSAAWTTSVVNALEAGVSLVS